MFHLYDGLIKANVALNLTHVHREKVKKNFFFFFTALVSHWLLLLRFKCNAARRELNSRFFHFTMPDRRHQTKHLNASLFSRCVNKTCRNKLYTNNQILCVNKPLLFKLIKSGFWSLVSVFGCFGVYFFFFFLSLALILWYLVFAVLKLSIAVYTSVFGKLVC